MTKSKTVKTRSIKNRKMFVVDTNVLLHDPKALYNFQDNIVVIPAEVIYELDKKKTAEGEVGVNARRLNRILRNALEKGGLEYVKDARVPNSVTMKWGKGMLTLAVLHPNQLSDEDNQMLDAALVDRQQADHRILACAYYYHRYEKMPVFLVTKDANMAVKAGLLGINCEDYRNDKVTNEVDAGDHFREIEVGEIEMASIMNFISKGWNKVAYHEYTNVEIPVAISVPTNAYINEYFLLTDSETKFPVRYLGDSRWALLPIYAEYIRGNANASDRHGLQIQGGIRMIPKNMEQWIHLDAMLNPDIHLITCKGKAGTGKTFITIGAALSEVTSQHTSYEKLLIARPVVEMGKGIGFLPGDKDEKMNPYMQPYFDNMDVLYGSSSKRKDKKPNGNGNLQQPMKPWERLKNEGLLEIEALTYIRGRSIPNAIIIVDEAQNLTPHEVKTIVTRLGKGSKLVIMGDPAQIDHPFLDTASNGLVVSREKMKGQNLVAHTKMYEGVRSPVAELAATLL